MMDKPDAVIEYKQVKDFEFCPYCGSDSIHYYLGDYHGYTVCLECEDRLEFEFLIEGRGVLK